MQDLLETSDIVVLHCPLTSKTKNLINKDKIESMKRDSILINVARGAVVNETDLIEALENNIISGACLDVLNEESPFYKGEKILKAENILLTPHIGYSTKESMILRAEIVFDNLKAWLDEKQKNIIN